MLTCDLRGQVAGHQLSPFQFHRALSIGRSHACRPGAFAWPCVVLTYILLSTIGCVEICVNQPCLWPTCLQPPPGWLSRSADLIRTEETISSDFHFFEPPSAFPPRTIFDEGMCDIAFKEVEFGGQIMHEALSHWDLSLHSKRIKYSLRALQLLVPMWLSSPSLPSAVGNGGRETPFKPSLKTLLALNFCIGLFLKSYVVCQRQNQQISSKSRKS